MKIRAVWPIVKPFLEDIAKDQAWRPEDVYAECLYKDAVLYQNTDGFVVLKQVVEPYTDEMQLFVWIACSFRNSGPSLLDAYLVQIEEIARSINAKTIAFGTHRQGYERVFNPGEWKLTRQYERAVNYG